MANPSVRSVMIVEDEESFRESITLSFELGFPNVNIHHFDRVETAIQNFDRVQPDLITLDLGLPDGDGTKLLRSVRGTSDVPIIVLSGRDDDSSILTAIRLGADDYLVKPFSVIELQAHVEALLRRVTRPNKITNELIRLTERIKFDVQRAALLDGDGIIPLSAREFECMNVLVAAEGGIVQIDDLKSAVWHSTRVSDSAVKMVFYRLRQSLGGSPDADRLFQSHRGIGYSLNIR